MGLLIAGGGILKWIRSGGQMRPLTHGYNHRVTIGKKAGLLGHTYFEHLEIGNLYDHYYRANENVKT